MAIVAMQKLSLCAPKKNRKKILELLQHMSVMEVDNTYLDRDISEDFPEDTLQKMDTKTAEQTFEKNAEVFDSAIALLKPYSKRASQIALFSGPDEISSADFERVIASQQTLLKEAAAIQNADKEISECKGTISKDENQIASLEPWMKLDVPMNLRGTHKTRLLLGTMPGALDEAALYAAAIGGTEVGKEPPLTCEVLSAEGSLSYVAVLCLRSDRDQVLSNLRSAGFARPSSLGEGTPAELKASYEEDIKAQEARIDKLKDRIASYADKEEDFRIASDYYRTRAAKYRLLGTIPQSESAFFLEGWVEKEKAAPLAKLLEEKYGAIVETEEIREGELEPTLLKNNKFSESAEGVLESYGLPTHGRVDPTFVMSIFYVFFFGMMLSDAGYGLVMSVGCAIALLKFKDMGDGLKKTLKLFFWCGLSTVFWGFMYGGFFGDAIDVIAKTFFGYTGDTILKPLWFAPIDEPMRLLVWCMLFGLIHLFAGLGMKGYEYLKDGDVLGFFSDVVSWYLLLIGLTLMLLPSDIFASISGTQITFPAWVGTLAKILALVGAVIIILMSGRDKKNWGVRIALGAYDLYGVTSWLSDVLSYSRLLALGLATGVIANVINMMAAMGGNNVFGVIAFILIFLIGHVINIGINALGAYVHTNRLQYVEFFGKFYDAGGKKFVPFQNNQQYVQIKEEK